jgi:hypothetical protein
VTTPKPPNAFLTGSRVYGEPTPDSDVDLVVLIDKAGAAQLEALLGRDLVDYDHTCISVRSGRINLLLCTELKVFEGWRKGTDVLAKVAPVPRDKAADALGVLRGWMGESPKSGMLKP